MMAADRAQLQASGELSAPALAASFQGNRIRVGIVSEASVVTRGENYACDRTSPMRFVDSLCVAIQDFLAQHGEGHAFDSIGVSIGGWVDMEEGIWRYTRKVDGFRDPVPLAAILHRRLGLRAYIDNDLHMSTLAELRCGVGRSFSNLLFYHLGNGIGVGVAAEGQLIRGTANYSGECGHGFYDVDGKGQYDMLEDFASGRGMVETARALLPHYRDSTLAAYERDDTLSYQAIFDGQRLGDELCKHVVQRALRGIGFSVVNLLSVTNSEALVFGGGILSDGHMMQWLIDLINEYLSPPTRQTLSYVGTSRIHWQDIALIGTACMLAGEERAVK